MIESPTFTKSALTHLRSLVNTRVSGDTQKSKSQCIG